MHTFTSRVIDKNFQRLHGAVKQIKQTTYHTSWSKSEGRWALPAAGLRRAPAG